MEAFEEKRTGYYFEISSREDSRPIWHRELELVFVLKGKGFLRMEDRSTPYSLKEGDIFTIGSFEMHEIHLDPGGLTLSLFLSPTFLSFYFPETESLVFSCNSFVFSDKEQKNFDILRTDFACAFQTSYRDEAHHAALHLRSKIITLLDDLIRYFSAPAPKTAPALNKGRSHLRTATHWIDHHYAEDLTLKEIADRIYLSESYLSRLFKQTLGLTFTEYLNQVRLHYASLLLRGGASVTEAAAKSGFRNTNAFIQSFKQIFRQTPGQYKKELGRQFSYVLEAPPKKEADKLVVLNRYLHRKPAAEPPTATTIYDEREVTATLFVSGRKLTHNWKKLINVGYAHDLLYASVQKQVQQAQAEIGFRYARVKGIFDDDVLFYDLSNTGTPTYSFAYLDELFDFLLSAGFLPFIELGNMPSKLARTQFTVFKRPSFFSMPKDMEKWTALVSDFILHLLQRYGSACVQQWLFSPCFNPFFLDAHENQLPEYFSLYRESYRTVRRLLPNAVLCGSGDFFFPVFLDRCLAEDCVPDCVAIHAFFTAPPESEHAQHMKLHITEDTFPLAVTGDEAYLKHLLEQIKKTLNERNVDKRPILLDEWNNSFWQRDLCNDTCYKSASLFRNILENYDDFWAMGYWTISDFLEELTPSSTLFHGGFGLFTRNGLAKSSYRAMQLLCQAGDTLAARQDGCLITTSPRQVQIFLYNAADYDLLYRFRHTTNITLTRRYDVLNKRNPQDFHIKLCGLQPGKYTLSRYSIGRNGGSVYDAWVAMGAPERISDEIRRYLECQSYPALQVQPFLVQTPTTLHEILQPHEVRLITLTPAEENTASKAFSSGKKMDNRNPTT